MRRFSPKRRKRLSEAAPFREAFKLEVGHCERCGKRRHLIIHEIARGCDRQKALDKRYAVLVLCDPVFESGCHGIVGAWPRARQLCLLYLRRPYDFDLSKYHILIARFHPDMSEVLECVEEVMEEIA